MRKSLSRTDRRNTMVDFNGRSFLLGIQHLDASSQELYERHGTGLNGRWSLVEQISDEAMLRLVGNDVHLDPHAVDYTR